jgi:hypothetical protein
MTYDRRTRDRYRRVTTGVTGAVGVGALTLTGGLMGLAAGEQQADPTEGTAGTPATSASIASEQPRARKPRLRERPYVTRVTTRYVAGATSAGTAPSSGGAVSSGSSGGSTSGPSTPVRPPEPAPAPPPAPSSGS